MCKKTLREDYDVFEISCGHPKKCDDGVACEVGVHKMVAYTTYELCSDCAKRVENFIKKGLEPVVVGVDPKSIDCSKINPSDAFPQRKQRKTCDTCVHFMGAKSMCLKKKIPIRANDRDACDDWSEIKSCTNCKWKCADADDCLKERVFCGSKGYCDAWES